MASEEEHRDPSDKGDPPLRCYSRSALLSYRVHPLSLKRPAHLPPLPEMVKEKLYLQEMDCVCRRGNRREESRVPRQRSLVPPTSALSGDGLSGAWALWAQQCPLHADQKEDYCRDRRLLTRPSSFPLVGKDNKTAVRRKKLPIIDPETGKDILEEEDSSKQEEEEKFEDRPPTMQDAGADRSLQWCETLMDRRLREGLRLLQARLFAMRQEQRRMCLVRCLEHYRRRQKEEERRAELAEKERMLRQWETSLREREAGHLGYMPPTRGWEDGRGQHAEFEWQGRCAHRPSSEPDRHCGVTKNDPVRPEFAPEKDHLAEIPLRRHQQPLQVANSSSLDKLPSKDHQVSAETQNVLSEERASMSCGGEPADVLDTHHETSVQDPLPTLIAEGNENDNRGLEKQNQPTTSTQTDTSHRACSPDISLRQRPDGSNSLPTYGKESFCGMCDKTASDPRWHIETDNVGMPDDLREAKTNRPNTDEGRHREPDDPTPMVAQARDMARGDGQAGGREDEGEEGEENIGNEIVDPLQSHADEYALPTTASDREGDTTETGNELDPLGDADSWTSRGKSAVEGAPQGTDPSAADGLRARDEERGGGRDLEKREGLTKRESGGRRRRNACGDCSLHSEKGESRFCSADRNVCQSGDEPNAESPLDEGGAVPVADVGTAGDTIRTDKGAGRRSEGRRYLPQHIQYWLTKNEGGK